jgi:hypothetical protein
MFPAETLTLLRIDDPRCQDQVDDNQAGSHLAMLTTLYNFSVTTLLHPLAEQGLRQRAVKVINHAFHIAYSILLESFAGNGGPFLSLAALQLSSMMAQCHYQLHVELGDCREAWNSLNHYRFVQRALEEETRHPNPLEGLAVTHAKAA